MPDRQRQEFRKHAARLTRPKRRRRRATCARVLRGLGAIRFPWMLLNTVLLMITVLKAAILLQVGDARYVARLASYDRSDLRTQIGVAIMQPDSLTLKLRDLMRPLLVGGAKGRAWHAKRAATLRLRPP